jgi:hypothetical protein
LRENSPPDQVWQEDQRMVSRSRCLAPRWRVAIALLLVASGGVMASDVARLRAQGSGPITARVAFGPEEQAVLTFQAFEVFAADAEIVIMHAKGRREILRPPAAHYFRALPGEHGVVGFVRIAADGRVDGVLRRDGALLEVGANAEGDIHAHKPVRAQAMEESFQCGSEQSGLESVAANAIGALAPAVPKDLDVSLLGLAYTARVAIDTDNEFLTLFAGNTTAATTYVGNLIGFISSLYLNETSTSMTVSYLRLWDGATDPYVQTASTSCMLLEVGKHWNDTQAAVTPRTIVHLLSGKSVNAGTAWVGVLCSNAFNTSPTQIGANCPGIDGATTANYGGAYGVTSGIDANFNPGNPSVIWDVAAVAHEIGHNFNSPHTHCYANIGGNAAPIDQCNGSQTGASCHVGATSLPGPQGQATGTLMSYCHLLSGGYSNVAMSFGTGHTFGVAPERVPTRMSEHVVNRAAASPQCLAPITGGVPALFKNGFE